jgi:hypothetical protein
MIDEILACESAFSLLLPEFSVFFASCGTSLRTGSPEALSKNSSGTSFP